MVTPFDIVILGGGLNGAALAAALRHGPYRVALVEARPPAAPDAGWDHRVYAYSPGNVDWLRSLGGWVKTARCQAVHAMRIHGDDGGRLNFDAIEAGVSELAWIAENKRLQWALWQSLGDSPAVKILAATPTGVTWGEDGTHALNLANGDTLHTRLLVAADGANSWLRAQAGIGFDIEDYVHVGVVGNFACEKPHRGTAFQWFRQDGVLAYLPLPDNLISIVWSTPPEHAAELQALDAESFAARVAEAGKHTLGVLRLVTPGAGFPLKRRRAHEWVRPGLVLLGDAAHTVHPLAGQGVNLGFRDSRLLADMLASGGDPGEISRLTSYAARRREDVLAMQGTSGNMKKLFAREDRLSRTARNLGMNFTDWFAPASQTLMHRATL